MVILLSPNTIDPLRSLSVDRFSVTRISVIVSPLGLLEGLFPPLPSKEDSDIRPVELLPCVFIELKVAAATRVIIDECVGCVGDMDNICSVFMGEFVYKEVIRDDLLAFSGGIKKETNSIRWYCHYL